ncbi:MAG: response regulator [Alphaproteobacteria bacterium]|nr:response regulator [Alphaproteobacteria bacterium]
MTRSLNHVVCIDDEKDILEIVRLCLETFGKLKVTTFTSGAQALLEIEKLKPDIILIDWLMPEMSGSEVFNALIQKEVFRETPIVFMTARVQPSEVDEYLKLGVAGVIPKPFDPMQIADLVKEIWEQCNNEDKKSCPLY